MKIFFLYYFFVAGSYDVQFFRLPALYANHRPITTIEECQREAFWRQEAQLTAIANGGPYADVLVICEQEKR